MSGSLAGAAPS